MSATEGPATPPGGTFDVLATVGPVGIEPTTKRL